MLCTRSAAPATIGEALEVPLRERNTLLDAAGFASAYGESAWSDPVMGPIDRVVDFLLEQHCPFPAVLMDRSWNVLRTNRATGAVFAVFGRRRALPAATAQPAEDHASPGGDPALDRQLPRDRI